MNVTWIYDIVVFEFVIPNVSREDKSIPVYWGFFKDPLRVKHWGNDDFFSYYYTVQKKENVKYIKKK